MQQLMDIRPIALTAQTVHRVDDGRGQSITCLRGSVWITQSNDLRDIVLEAGQSFVLDRNGTAVVFALKDAAIVIGLPGQIARADISIADRDRAA